MSSRSLQQRFAIGDERTSALKTPNAQLGKRTQLINNDFPIIMFIIYVVIIIIIIRER